MKFIQQLKQNPNLLVRLLLGLWLVLNILQGVFMELSNDEAYYWFVSEPLDWGFFDHPPMISLLTWLGVNLLGDTEIGVRFFSILLQPIYLYVFWMLVRPRGVQLKWQMAWMYCVVAFAVPLLQLYGFVATPDAPLMMSVALTLWCYRYFMENQHDWRAMLLLGASFALMAYSKYHGALVVLCIVVSNLSLLLNWRFWVSGAVALMLVLPHLWWQYQHDWVSLSYHLIARNSEFEWMYVGEFFLNVWGTFNPFVLPVFVYLLYIYRKGYKDRPPFERALLWMAWGFLLFFLFSTKRGHVQPQWLIPMVFPMLYFVVRYCMGNPRTRRFVMRSSYVVGGLFLVIRVFVMSYHGTEVPLDIFGNQARYGGIDSLSQDRPIVMTDNYWAGAKINYYTQNREKCFARPSIYGRDSEWSLRDIDGGWYGRQVYQEFSGAVQDSLRRLPEERLPEHYLTLRIDGSTPLFYDTVNFYIPTHRVRIESASLPPKLLIKQQLAIDLVIDNPYPYDIPLQGNQFHLMMQFAQGRDFRCTIELPITHVVLPAGALTRVTTTVQVPDLETGEYLVGFALIRPRFDGWYNSKQTKMQIVNPKTRV